MAKTIMTQTTPAHYPAVIIGGGQAGLSVSYCLQQENIKHLVIEKSQILNSWKSFGCEAEQ